MEVTCYVCNNRTKEWTQNLAETKSKHSGTPITVFITGFLKDYISLRDINDVTNCICSDCLSRIYSYDWMILKVKEQEREFHMLLMSTEKNFISSRIKTEDLVESKAKIANGRKFKDESSKEVKPVSGTEARQTDTPGDNVKRSKPIVVRVVKRVPFLKSKPVALASITSKAPAPIEPTAPIPASLSEPPLKKRIIEPETNIIQVSDGDVSQRSFVEDMSQDAVRDQCLETVENAKNAENVDSQSRCFRCLPSFKSSKNTKGKGYFDSWEIVTNPSILSSNQLKRYCTSCKLFCKKTKYYENHMAKHQRTCELCDITFKAADEHAVHMVWHKTPEGLMCRICQFKLPNEDEHRKHLDLHEGKSDRHCVICDKGYATKAIMRTHVKNHGEPEVLCDLCGKVFYGKDTLKVHRRLHIDEKQFECTFCSKAFKTMQYLRTHLRIHTSTERPFNCSFCDMSFKLKDHWRAHERRHIENTKTVKCTLCSAAFEHKFHLKQHMERRHRSE
ncbi:zinc finger protein 25-like [Sitodiplosis mosellana]|uniref:zinc finger protein 25-like n=1 Tax=Sitodiplosis mosellana TaxID=263140 RepID=UPI002444103B|nr:zinc finger protein 25-like [Sitodiplosis mosellana]